MQSWKAREEPGLAPPQPCKCVLVTDLVSDGSLTWEFVLRTGAASWDYTSNAGDVFKKRAGLQ